MADVRANAGIPLAAYFGGMGDCAPIVVDSTTGDAYSLKDGDVVMRIGGPAEATATTSTTNGSAKTIVTIPITTATVIYAVVIGTRTGGSSGSAGDAAAYIICALYKSISDMASEVGESAIFTAEDQSGWDCTITADGGNALIQVTGAADNNVSWVAYYKTYTI